MKAAVALVAGYLIGATSGSRELEQLKRAVRALSQTEEFAEVVASARSHAGAVLRDLALVVGPPESEPDEPDPNDDLVARVRALVARD